MLTPQKLLYESGIQRDLHPPTINSSHFDLKAKLSFIERFSDIDIGDTVKSEPASTRITHPELYHDGYRYLYSLVDPGELLNLGMWVTRSRGSNKVLSCKTTRPGEAGREAEILRYLQHHPNITDAYDYIPSITTGALSNYCSEPEESQKTARYHMFDKIMLEFCDRGTLKSLIQRYRTLQLPIPEAFIWKVFESLAEALRLCHTGEHCEFEGGHKEWDPIIHRNITPSNILLSTISGDSLYPRVVLGEFGCAVLRSNLMSGTTCAQDLPMQEYVFWAPETNEHDTYSDIYQVGLVIWCMCYGTETPYTRGEISVQDVEVKRGVFKYSGELRRILNQCLQYTGMDRPKVAELLEKIQKARHELQKKLQKEMLLPSVQFNW